MGVWNLFGVAHTSRVCGWAWFPLCKVMDEKGWPPILQSPPPAAAPPTICTTCLLFAEHQLIHTVLHKVRLLTCVILTILIYCSSFKDEKTKARLCCSRSNSRYTQNMYKTGFWKVLTTAPHKRWTENLLSSQTKH